MSGPSPLWRSGERKTDKWRKKVGGGEKKKRRRKKEEDS